MSFILLKNQEKMIKPGQIYQHFKGNKYKVIAIARHSETLEDLIIYQNIEKGDIWARPIRMFLDKKEVDGKIVNRFKKLNL